MKATLVGLIFAIVLAAPAQAVELTAEVNPPGGVRLDRLTEITGTARDGATPLADRVVRLEVSSHPFNGGWESVAQTRTDATGAYRFAHGFRRNHRVRVRLDAVPASESAPAIPETLTPYRNAYVLPAFKLSYRERGEGRIRLTQTYRVPRSVRLTAPTRFYLGPCEPNSAGACTASSAPFVREVRTRRLGPGRFRASASVRIPSSYGGRFSYVSCFDYTDTSGMGDPGQECPRSAVRLTRPAAPASGALK